MSTWRKATDILLGFAGTASAVLLFGLGAVWVCDEFFPNWYWSWSSLPAAPKLLLGLIGVALLVFVAVLLWRKRKFVAIGILVYLVLDLLNTAMGF